jgi:vacuolar-type H+-ATPase subunit H
MTNKNEVIKEVFSAVHKLKTSSTIFDGELKERILTLERKAQEILFEDFEKIHGDEVSDYLDKIRKNGKDARKELKRAKNFQEKSLKIASYVDKTIEYLNKIKEMI